jgi:diaminopimelate epimerase
MLMMMMMYVCVCMCVKDCQYTMRIINADGTEAEMCGNGIRCLALFIRELEGAAAGSTCTTVAYTISTLAGKIVTEVISICCLFASMCVCMCVCVYVCMCVCVYVCM